MGLNVTSIVQLLPAATEAPQLLLSAKSPLAAMPEIVKLPVPMFVSVTGCAVLVVPTVWFAKARLVADNFTAGAVDTGVTVSVAGALVWLPAELLTVTLICAPLSADVVEGIV
jgi:hypothetical protein